MGFGGGYSTPNMPVYIKQAEPNNDIAPLEYKEKTLLCGYKYDKDCLANFLLQCGYDENEIRIMLQYVFWELQGVDFENILANPTSSPFCTLLSNSPVSKLCRLAKQMHEDELREDALLNEAESCLANYTKKQLYALSLKEKVRRIYRELAKYNRTNGKRTQQQLENLALFFFIYKKKAYFLLMKQYARMNKECRQSKLCRQ